MTWLLPPNKYHRIWIIGVRIEIGLALFTETLFLCKARDTMAKAFFPLFSSF
ncbi:hypothetical protein C8R46DRAFT_1208242 [Mycena filopes]|nr:hypothetical protein C8R46DRAFT_1208242 [Mycena filopes]